MLNILLFVLIAVFLLLGTPLGVKLAHTFAEPYLPEGMQLEGLSGSVLTGITLQRFNYQTATQQIELKQGLVKCHFRIFSQTLYCETIAADSLVVTLGETPPSEPAPFVWPEIQLPEIQLPIQIQLDELRINRFTFNQGEQSETIAPITLSLSAKDSLITINQLTIVHAMVQFSLQGHILLIDDYPMKWHSELRHTENNQALHTVQSDIQGGLNQLTWQLSMAEFNTDITLSLNHLLTQTPQIQLQAKWQQLVNLIGSHYEVAVQNGQLSVRADLKHYQLQFDTGLQHPQFPQTDIHLALKGQVPYQQEPSADFSLKIDSHAPNLPDLPQLPSIHSLLQGSWHNHRLTLQPSELQVGENQIQLSAEVNLSQQQIQQAQISMQLEALAQLWPELKGKLNGRCTVTGQWLAPDYQCKLDAAQTHFQSAYQAEHVSITASGQASPEAKQTIRLQGKQLKFDQYAIANTQLDFSGDLQLDKSKTLRLEADGISAPPYQLAQLSVNGQGHLNQFKLSVNAQQLTSVDQQFQQLQASLAGSLQQHQFNAAVTQNAQNSINLALNGNYQQAAQHWQGQLTQLQLNTDTIQNWQLSAPSAEFIQVQLEPLQVKLPTYCLAHQPTQLCLSAQLIDQNWRAETQLSQLQFADWQALLPSTIQLKGGLSLQANASGSLQSLHDASLTMQLEPGHIRFNDPYTDETSQIVTLDILGGSLNGTLTENDLQSTADIALGQQQFIRFNGHIAQLQNGIPVDQSPLKAQLDVNLNQFNWLTKLVPEISQADIQLQSQFNLAGTMQKPDLNGQILLKDSQVQIPLLGIQPVMNLAIQADDLENIALQGQLKSNKGQLNVSGQLGLADWQPELTLKLQGSDFKVISTETFDIETSPNLNIQFAKQHLYLNGSLAIPYAKIEIKELPPSAVSLSDDVVIVDSTVTTPKEPTLQIHSKLDVQLGKNVSFKGFGLKTNIQGQLQIHEQPKQPPKGSGNLQLVDGRYKAYGQDLKIRKGQLNFVGPLDNPGLDFLAVREVEDVSAGLKVQGTLKKPLLTLYSDPSMENSDIMSYIVLGRPLSKAQSSDGNQVASAALAMGVEGANYISQQITSQLGLPPVKLNVAGQGEQQQVDVGAYLTPSLYISYGQKVFEKDPTQRNSWRLRYQINPKLALESTTTDTTFIDLIYEIETDTEIQQKFNYTPDKKQ